MSRITGPSVSQEQQLGGPAPARTDATQATQKAPDAALGGAVSGSKTAQDGLVSSSREPDSMVADVRGRDVITTGDGKIGAPVGEPDAKIGARVEPDGKIGARVEPDGKIGAPAPKK